MNHDLKTDVTEQKSEKKHKNTLKLLKLSLSWVVSLGIIMFILSRVDTNRIISSLTLVDKNIILMVIFISTVAHIYFSSEKFRLIVGIIGGDISFYRAMLAKVGGIPLKHFFPVKSGELFRAIYLKKVCGLEYIKGGWVIFSGFALSFFTLFFLMSIGLAFFKLYTLFLPFVMVIILILCQKRFSERIKKKFPALLVYSLIFESAKILNYLLIFRSVGIVFPLGYVFLFIPLVILIASLPFAVWGIGTREAAILFFFKDFAPVETLFMTGILISIIEVTIPLFWGLVFLKPFINRLIDKT